MARPIWKDYFVTLTNTASDYPDGVQYRIKTGGNTIYQGRAFPRPGENSVAVRINDVCAAAFTRSGLTFVLYATFITEVYDDAMDTWDQIDSTTFRPDWSYDDAYDPYTAGCNFPITGVVLPTQQVPVSFVDDGATDVLIHDLTPGDFNDDFNRDFDTETDTPTTLTLSGNTAGHAHLINLANYAGVDYLECGDWDYTLQVKDICNGVVLFYVNAYGYLDSFVPEGHTRRVDNLTRYTRKGVYQNGPGADRRGTWNYANGIEERMTFRTGPLTTEQSERMHHLLNSPYVIMFTPSTMEYMPIVLTGNTNERKDATGSLHFYDIEAVVAQDRVRR